MRGRIPELSSGPNARVSARRTGSRLNVAAFRQGCMESRNGRKRSLKERPRARLFARLKVHRYPERARPATDRFVPHALWLHRPQRC